MYTGKTHRHNTHTRLFYNLLLICFALLISDSPSLLPNTSGESRSLFGSIMTNAPYNFPSPACDTIYCICSITAPSA